MISVAKDWNPKQKKLKALLANIDTGNEAIQLCLQMHSELHDSHLTSVNSSYQDELVTNLSETCFRYRPSNGFASIAWNIWHITRIEDAVSNLLIVNESQVLNKAWIKRIGSSISDTGNAMDKNEVDAFSKRIKMKELLDYRFKVGEKTQKILRELISKNLKLKPGEEQLIRLLKENVILENKKSIWLMDFWSKKTVAGLLMMPITRHQIVHLNDCIKLKIKFEREHRNVRRL